MQSYEWDTDVNLLSDMKKYIQQGMKRAEMLDFLQRDFPQYAWSLRSLCRRMEFYKLHYNDKTVSVAQLKEIVRKELKGPGQLLGYRAMHKKVRQEHNLLVTRSQVYDVMYDLNAQLLESRRPGVKKHKLKCNFTSKGPNWVHSMDGHDKLMGYQNSTFPLAVYGCMDTATRRLLWLRIWVSNSNPRIIGYWYLEYLMETKTLPNMIRVDKGTETGIMATMHAFLRRHHVDGAQAEDTVLYGPSTSNQIERWWKELHERLEKYYKKHLNSLKDSGVYDPHNCTDRELLAYIMIPLLQKELDVFKDSVWNTHRIRAQRTTILPDGIPDHMYSFPEKYGLQQCGILLTEDQLREAALVSGVLDVEKDFVSAEIRQQCEGLIRYPADIQPEECAVAFDFLKRNFRQ